MGATAINDTPSSDNWAKARPEGYKSPEFDKALAAFEAVARKSAPDPTIPAKPSLKGYETFVKEAGELLKLLKEQDAALSAVVAAATKCAGDLRKLSEAAEGEARIACFNAAGTASAIASRAATMKARIA